MLKPLVTPNNITLVILIYQRFQGLDPDETKKNSGHTLWMYKLKRF
jgi:hypothetical protein